MYKFCVSIKKETLLFLNDKVGLALMFGMPVLLVFIITIIQDSIYQVVDSKKISLLVVNNDEGLLGVKLTTMLDSSAMFRIRTEKNLGQKEIELILDDKKTLAAIYIPSDFTKQIDANARQLSQIVLSDFGLIDPIGAKSPSTDAVRFFHDPILQETYCSSINHILEAQLAIIENTRMIENIYREMGIDTLPSHLNTAIFDNRIKIERINSALGQKDMIPSSTQHNVPAWTIFAMFFMVVSLGTNIVKEKTSGSFMRIKTMPSRFSMVFVSKQLVYGIIAILQVALIFGIGYFILPLIHLPPLVFPSNITALVIVVFVCSFAAVSYALMVGALSKTQDQSNGFGAISVVVFAALGGVWVPTFVMPGYLQVVSNFSPLHWCIESFYILFLKQGNWQQLALPLFILTAFSLLCQLIAFIKIKYEH